MRKEERGASNPNLFRSSRRRRRRRVKQEEQEVYKWNVLATKSLTPV